MIDLGGLSGVFSIRRDLMIEKGNYEINWESYILLNK